MPEGSGRALVGPGSIGLVLPVGLAALAGAVYAYLAYSTSPLLLPAVLLGGTALAVSVSRLEIGIAIGLLLIPLGQLGALQVSFVNWQPWVPGTIWISLMFVIATGQALADRGIRRTRLSLAMLVYLCAGLLSVAVAAHPGLSKTPLRILVVGTMLFFTIAIGVRTRRQVMWVVGAFVACAALIGAVATRQYLTGATGDWGFVSAGGQIIGRATGGFSHPNQLGSFLALVIPLAVAGAILDRRRRWAYLVALALALAGVYFSFSRSALVALVAVPVAFVRGRRILVAIPIIAVAVLIAAPSIVKERFGTLTTSGGDLATRVDFWRTAENIWETHPIVGTGLGSFPDAYSAARVPGKEYLPTTFLQPPPHAHNIFLQHLAEQGLIGLSALLILLVAALRSGLALRRNPDRWIRTMGNALLAMLGVFLIDNQFDVTQVGETGFFLWAFLGLLSALTAIAQSDRAHGS